MIAVTDVQKSFDGGQVLASISFEVRPHTICAIVGPTACGKSTLLNLIARLDVADAGTIHSQASAQPGYMMQDDLLLPWRTLEENAALGAEIARGAKPSSKELASCFQPLGLWNERSKYPAMASGGMKQRTALARTLLLQRALLLLDEPFSSLDFDIKLKVQKFLLEYQARCCTTILWVTHDIEDAIAISDEVVVLSDKPARVKAQVSIDLGTAKRSPVEARGSHKFRDYFVQIADQLRYLDGPDAS